MIEEKDRQVLIQKAVTVPVMLKTKFQDVDSDQLEYNQSVVPVYSNVS